MLRVDFDRSQSQRRKSGQISSTRLDCAKMLSTLLVLLICVLCLQICTSLSLVSVLGMRGGAKKAAVKGKSSKSKAASVPKKSGKTVKRVVEQELSEDEESEGESDEEDMSEEEDDYSDGEEEGDEDDSPPLCGLCTTTPSPALLASTSTLRGMTRTVHPARLTSRLVRLVTRTRHRRG